MAVTRSTVESRLRPRAESLPPRRASRIPETVWLLIAALIVSGAWWLVYSAKVRRAAGPAAPFNLTHLDKPEQLDSVLAVFANPADRHFAERHISDYLADREGAIPNTGALARLRVPKSEVAADKGLDEFAKRAAAATGSDSILLLTPAEFAEIKPQISVRTLDDFKRDLQFSCGAILLAFFLTNIVWMIRRFTGPWAFLPLLLILTGIGLALMVALRDPLRDTLIFIPFAEGVAAGCIVMLVASQIDWEAATAHFSFVPLLGAVLLSVALIVAGTGPGGSDARVNLGPFQPVEAIKILLIFFIAGYFSKRWPMLRELRERRLKIPLVELPPLEYFAPVLVGVAVALVFFYLQKDLGPALVFACVFLTLYAIARNRAGLALLGLTALLSGFAIGYFKGTPKTVHDRVEMWLSPWSNSVHGGDQVVHSLWAMASGGMMGTGPGLGETGVVPAGYTDLIVSALGEEWGFAGIAVVYAIFALLLWLALRIARRARTDYALFLALGLGLLIAGELLLISCGILDLFPLSGVATPFLSYGRTAMLANFLIAGILLALGRNPAPESRTLPFHTGLKWVQTVAGLLICCVVAKAGWVQLAHADEIVGEGTLVLQADGGRRYVYNPRLIDAARGLQRGTIYDRAGLPLATSSWAELEQHRAEYKDLGIDIDQACNRADSRHYPFGGLTFHLLGDVRTRADWTAPNSSLVERDQAIRLQGYDDRARIVKVQDAQGKPFLSIKYDYRELLPLLRHRWEPDNPAVKRVRDRDRNVHLSLSAALQVKAGQILQSHLAAQHLTKGSVVVMEPSTGDLLASVNVPSPDFQQERLALGESAGALLDRARYGLYPPGSTFKVVTAIAALRLDPNLSHQTYQCIRLPDGRTGNYVGNSKRPIRDDVEDRSPHGTLDMNRALIVSCNAYFAQLGAYKVGPEQLLDTANKIGIAIANP
ncbi:MAG: FtsW/RodA/SpoVE family cell cycle protein, partial [Acidobacteriota bacterium]|nr:FtsW/RodA/SpoVE family cell cycle protein [Acidobacteriota bacterium]